MDRPDLPLNALRVFEVATRQGSFTRAAIELRVTQAAVSHQIARLEDLLGAPLFHRTSGGLVATDEALQLFPVVEQALDGIGRALDRVTGRHHIEMLNLGVVTTFATGWLIERLPAFEAAHPQVDLRLSTHNNRVDIPREGLDMAIRFGSGSWTGLRSRELLPAPLAPLCAPALAERLHHLEDLTRQRLLRSYRSDEWPRWCALADFSCPPLTGPVLDSSVALADLAAAGAGVALLPLPMFARWLREGRLVQPFAPVLEAGAYHLTWPADRVMSPAMTALMLWLDSAVADSRAES